jgi:N-dimethylarginine dimethylaminohydrolase
MAAAHTEADTAVAPAPRGGKRFGGHSMIAPLRRALVHLPGPEFTTENWRAYGLEGDADREAAVAEQERFLDILLGHGVELELLEEHASVQCTATFDPALITDEGAVILTSGRPERRAETFPMARKLLELEIPIIGWVGGLGTMDAGDSFWLDPQTFLVGRSYRTNDEGFRQLRRALDGIVQTFHQLELPHWEGPGKVLHLMSVVSLVDEDLAVVYTRAAPIRLLELLHEREYRIVEVPDSEFETQGANVLALEPGCAVICAGNPRTSAALRDAGVEVHEYEGKNISIRRISGPTCNTRPILRE